MAFKKFYRCWIIISSIITLLYTWCPRKPDIAFLVIHKSLLHDKKKIEIDRKTPRLPSRSNVSGTRVVWRERELHKNIPGSYIFKHLAKSIDSRLRKVPTVHWMKCAFREINTGFRKTNLFFSHHGNRIIHTCHSSNRSMTSLPSNTDVRHIFLF